MSDWFRILFAVGVLIFAPSLGWAVFVSAVPAYEHTGWFVRLLLSVPATLLCGLVLWPVTWLVCRGSAVLPLATLFAAIYTPVNAFMLVGTVNVALDQEPGRRVTVSYVRYEKRQKGSNRDILTSWDDPGDTVSLSTTLIRHELRLPGAPVSVTVHPGWLGLEWVSQVESVR